MRVHNIHGSASYSAKHGGLLHWPRQWGRETEGPTCLPVSQLPPGVYACPCAMRCVIRSCSSQMHLINQVYFILTIKVNVFLYKNIFKVHVKKFKSLIILPLRNNLILIEAIFNFFKKCLGPWPVWLSWLGVIPAKQKCLGYFHYKNLKIFIIYYPCNTYLLLEKLENID